jgi:hypothetical protein
MASTPAVAYQSLLNVGDKGAGFRLAWERPIQPGEHYKHIERWPILEGPDASPTLYSVVVSLDFTRWGVTTNCMAGLHGREHEQGGPFHCSLIQRGQDNHWDMYVTDDRVERFTEASGSMTTEDGLSLVRGRYFAEKFGQRLDGASALPTGMSTQFDHVLPYDPKIVAMAGFVFQLIDNGRPVHGSNGETVLVVGDAGMPGQFTKSNCTFMVPGKADERVPGYSCDLVGYYAKDWGAGPKDHFVTDFTVRKTK